MTLWHPGSPVPEDWTELGYEDHWSVFLDFGFGTFNPRFFRDPSGIVTVQALGTFDAAPDPWYTYAGFSPGAPMVILPEGYRPDVWLGPLAGISTDMAGNVKSEPAFLFPDGRLMFPSLADGGIYEYFAVMFSFRAA